MNDSSCAAMNSTTTSPFSQGPRPSAGATSAGINTTTVITMRPDDPFIQPKLDVLVWALTAVAGVVVGLRIYNKFRRHYQLWWDDYIAVVSWTLLVALGLALTFEIMDGAGRHAFELSASQLRLFNLTDEVGSTIAIVVTALAKTGFAVTLLKAAEGSARFLVWLTLAVVNVVSGVAGMLLWLQCTPLRMNFEPVPRGSCFPSQVRVGIQIMNTSVSGTADIVLSVLAVYIVHKSTMKQGYWVGALICAILGMVAGVTSFAKSAIMHILVGGDLSFDAVTLIILGVIEPALLIIAASLPELRDFVWKHPKPVRYNNDEFNFQNNRLDYSEYEYARRQYMEAGGKSTFSYGSDVARPTPNFKLGPWI